jgi:hypothetical protein
LPTPILIRVGDIELEGELNDSATATKIVKALPLKSTYNVWGDEVYFGTSVRQGPETPLEIVEVGDLAYWPPGKAFCIFYGPTPVGKGDEVRPASPVNPIGKVHSEVSVLKGSVPGDIMVEKR